MTQLKIHRSEDRRSPARSTCCSSRGHGPRISIITPSFNQGQFLDETIRSVLSQDYPNLDYVVMDGGSTDGSVEIIKSYESQLTYWQSQADGGQYDAINKGFAKTTGEVMGWLNSDDKYAPGALDLVAELFAQFPDIEWVTTMRAVEIDRTGQSTVYRRPDGFDRASFCRARNIPGRTRCPEGTIQQESTLWRRSLWDRAGGRLDTSLEWAADFELWARFYEHAELYSVDAVIAGARRHPEQKTAQHLDDWADEAFEVLRRRGGRTDSAVPALVTRVARRLPSIFRRPLQWIGLRSRSHRCVRRNGEWVIDVR